MLWRSNSKSRPGEDLNSLCSWWVFPLQSQHKCLVQLHNYSLYCNQFHSSLLPKIIRDFIPNLHTPCKREMTVLLASRSAGLHSLEVHLLHIYSTIQPQKWTTGYSCTTLWTRAAPEPASISPGCMCWFSSKPLGTRQAAIKGEVSAAQQTRLPSGGQQMHFGVSAFSLKNPRFCFSGRHSLGKLWFLLGEQLTGLGWKMLLNICELLKCSH